jgi:riboflavin kinase, archaea type
VIVIIGGVVETGIGDYGKWIALLQTQYEIKTGMMLYPGTLNVRLKEAFDLPGNCGRLETAEYGGTVSVNIAPCTVFG